MLLAATVVGLGCLARFGGGGERIACGVVTAYLVLVPIAQRIISDEKRPLVAALEVVLFLAFWLLAEKTRRWWFTAAAGFQLIAVMTFAVQWRSPESYLSTGVGLRYGAWALINLTFFAGAWEAWADRRYCLEEATPCGSNQTN